MAKKTKTLLILGILFVVLCGAYIGIVKYKEYAQTKEEELQKAKEEANKIIVSNMENLFRIDFNNGGEEIAFVKQNDQWSYEADPEFPLNISMVTLIENNVNPLEATRKLEDKEELSSYGLESTGKTITVADASGNSKEILIGNQNEYTGDYYAMVQGENEVYTIGADLVTAIDHKQNDFIQLETIPSLTEDQINSITATSAQGSIAYQKEEETPAETGGETREAEWGTELTAEKETESKTVWNQIKDGNTSRIEDISQLQSAIASLGNLTITACENYHAAPEILASYGLDEANKKEIIVDYTESGEQKTVIIHLGSKDEGGEYYYVNLDDSKAVNKVSASVADKILSALLP